MPESVAVNIRNRSYTVGALVDLPSVRSAGSAVRARQPLRRPRALPQGQPAVLRLQLRRHHRAAGRPPPRTCRPGPTCSSRPASRRTGEDPPGVAVGNLTLWHGDRKVGEARIKTQPGKFAIAGEGLCVGRDSGEPVTDDYPGQAPWAFTGGTLHLVAVDVSGEPYIDLEREAAAMLARE